MRRQAICLLAVMLDPAGAEAPALHKLLEQIPKVGHHSGHALLCTSLQS